MICKEKSILHKIVGILDATQVDCLILSIAKEKVYLKVDAHLQKNVLDIRHVGKHEKKEHPQFSFQKIDLSSWWTGTFLRGCKHQYIAGLSQNMTWWLNNKMYYSEDPFSEETISYGTIIMTALWDARQTKWIETLERWIWLTAAKWHGTVPKTLAVT